MTDYPGFLPFADYQAMDRPEQVWLVQSLIPYGGWVNIYGQPKKARKSYLALGFAWAISSGQEEFLGFPIHHHGPVLYLQVDTPDPTWAQRTRDIHTGGYDLSNVWFASTATVPMPFNLDAHGDWLTECVRECPESVMIIYDTSRKMHLEDENSSQGMTVVMMAMEEAAGMSRAKVLISHENKGGGGSDRGQSKDPSEDTDGDSNLMRGNRGSGAVAGAMDTVIFMSPKGIMQYQGRQVPEQHKRLRFDHTHTPEHPCPHASPAECMGFMWHSDESSDLEKARELCNLYKNGSERSLARLLASARSMNEDKARSIIRRIRGTHHEE